MKAIWGGGRWRVFPEKAMGGLWATPQDLARFVIAVQPANSGKTTGQTSPAIAEEFLKAQFDAWPGIGTRLDGTGENRGFHPAGENFGYFARFGAGVSNGRGRVIL
jgi:CubicO group peptidase (beta-lactamase class C family)